LPRYLVLVFLALNLALSYCLFGQAQSDSKAVITLEASIPPSIEVGQVGAVITGTLGRTTYYYWVVANYPIGSSLPSGPVVVHNGPDILSGTNYITLYWPHKLYAISYDLLRTTSTAFPNGTASIAVATGLTGYNQADIGGALAAYTLHVADRAVGYIRLDNIQSIKPTLIMAPFNIAMEGDTIIYGDIHAVGDIHGDDIDADVMLSTPLICITGGVCVNSVNQQQGQAPQWSIPFASHNNQLDGDLTRLRIAPGGDGIGINLPDAPTTAIELIGVITIRGISGGFGTVEVPHDGDDDLVLATTLAGSDVIITPATGVVRYQTWESTGLTFLTLPAAINGTVVYCSDCTIASPCAAGGTGALAKRLNAAWICN